MVDQRRVASRHRCIGRAALTTQLRNTFFQRALIGPVKTARRRFGQRRQTFRLLQWTHRHDDEFVRSVARSDNMPQPLVLASGQHGHSQQCKCDQSHRNSPRLACIIAACPCLSRALFARLGVMPKEDEAQSAGKDENVRHVEHKRIVDATAGHVQEVEDKAIHQPVQNIGQRAPDQQSGACCGQGRLRMPPQPNQHANANRQGNCDKDPDTYPIPKKAKVNPPVLAIPKAQQGRPDIHRIESRHAHHMDHQIFAELVQRKGGKGEEREELHKRLNAGNDACR
mmetsp:Transcript_22535/g.36543  ORF Transcript_22535/g.36543 Transcript_22535/m.36543 type:complete len:283 (-) Transcript_22535:3748-4596(-)